MTWPAVGLRVLLRIGHPWAGHMGTVVAVRQIRRPGLLYPRVRLDDGPGVPPGHECFVVSPEQIEVL
jgi:hypothetical protein